MNSETNEEEYMDSKCNNTCVGRIPKVQENTNSVCIMYIETIVTSTSKTLIHAVDPVLQVYKRHSIGTCLSIYFSVLQRDVYI